VPENFEDLCDWAYLAKNKNAADKKHCHHLLYTVPRDTTKVFVVTMRLQGFVEKQVLTTLRDWNG
jgi:hypothetical protein